MGEIFRAGCPPDVPRILIRAMVRVANPWFGLTHKVHNGNFAHPRRFATGDLRRLAMTCYDCPACALKPLLFFGDVEHWIERLPPASEAVIDDGLVSARDFAGKGHARG